MDCKHTSTTKKVKLIPGGRKETYWPKYIPQIRETCLDCRKFIGFVGQTPGLIDSFNKQLEAIQVIEKRELEKEYVNAAGDKLPF